MSVENDQTKLRERQWLEYAERTEQTTTLPIRVEVTISHHGYCETAFCRIRKIGEFAIDGMRLETWECVTKRDIPPTFTVPLAKGSLETHIELVKFRETNWGARLISRALIGSLLVIDFMLMMALTGVLPAEIDLLDWYWMLAFGFVGGMILGISIYNQVATCGRLDLECAYPNEEKGAHHACYVIGSKSSNVIEQLDAYDRFLPHFGKLIEGMTSTMTARNRRWMTYAMQMEYENDKSLDDEMHRVTRATDRKLKIGGTKVVEKTNWTTVAVMLIMAVAATAGVVYYLKGGGP